jgi:hypothetical protein
MLIYFAFRIITTGTFIIEKYDWGVDMGYTQLFWGFLLVMLSILLLFYFKQVKFRPRDLDKAIFVLLTPFLFYVLVGFLLFQFLAHAPSIDLYHKLDGKMIFNQGFDKIGHFVLALLLTVAALRMSPRRSTVLLVLLVVWLITAFYELFEIQFIYYLSDKPYENWLFPEIEDVFFDMSVNSMGVVMGWVFMKNKIRMME